MEKIIKKIITKMDLLKDFNFVMIHIIRKMVVLLKNHLNYFKNNVFKCFLRSIINFYISKKIVFHNI